MRDVNLKNLFGGHNFRVSGFYLLVSFFIFTLGTFVFQPKLPEVMPPPTHSPTPPPPRVESFEVPILMYHYIQNPPPDERGQKLSVTPTAFDDQLKWLRELGYESIYLSDVSDPERTSISRIYAENRKPVVLTFDDGYEDAYTTALPILKKYHFFATFYIIRNFVGLPGYVNHDQVGELVSQGMEIGSHTLDHPELNRVSLSEARRQIFDSKGEAITFCYPSGKFNDTIVGLVKEAGYLSATTTIEGIVNQDSDFFKLPRVRMSDMTFEDFKNALRI